MELPALLHKSLQYCSEASEDQILFKLLVAHPPHLIKFLERACEDETWAEMHPQFMQAALSWVTEQFYQDHLLMSFAQRIAKAVRNHYETVMPFLPLNLKVKLKDSQLSISGLMFASSSEFLREMCRRECRDRNIRELFLQEISWSVFNAVEEYILKGSTFDLALKDKQELIRILNIAAKWDLKELSRECQIQLKKYLTQENVVETLLKAIKNNREELKTFCCNFINDFKLGCRVENRGPETLAFEFFEFTENSMGIFNQVKEVVTHLVCGGSLTEEIDFTKVVNQCPKLICLDISRSNNFSQYLKEIPEDLQELDVGACSWMTNDNFQNLVGFCPALSKLTLTSNIKVDFEGWGALKKLPALHSLDLTRCSQVGDEELKIILEAAPELVSLSLEECRGISDAGFIDIPNFNSQLTYLNLARTYISDLPLIEISSRCKMINTLNLTRCERLSDKAIEKSISLINNLHELIIIQWKASKSTIKEIKKMKPYLNLVLEHES